MQITTRRPRPSRFWRMLHHGDRLAHLPRDPALCRAGVALINPHVLEIWKGGVGLRQQERQCRTVLDIGCVDGDAQKQTARINEKMALPPADALATTVAAQTANTGCFDRLTIHDTSTRLKIAALPLAFLRAEDAIALCPESAETPGSEVYVHRGPWRDIVRQVAPWASRTQGREMAFRISRGV